MSAEMNHQQTELFFSGAGYPMNNPNRSPGSSRPGYNTASGLSGMNRSGQRQMESMGPTSAGLFPGGGDDRFGTYDSSSFRHNRIQPSPGFDNFVANNSAWQYNNSGANTVNGPLGDGRIRPGGRRAAIPTEWTMPEQPALGSQALNTPSTQYSAVYPPSMGFPNGEAGFANERHGYQNAMYDPRHDPKSLPSDLIPTAIVIKNIPFNVRKEMLTTLMSDLGLPQPYAFNYHFDNGIFRGLAFANFQSPMDTQTVIEQLNGYDVQGRKLRVEYKKMLPEHERERIEREKREKRGQLEEQHQPLQLHAQTSMHSLNAAHTSRSRTSPLRESPTGLVGGRNGPTSGPVGEVNLNDPDTLSFYTELTLFRNDPNREIFIFPNSLTGSQRKIVHILAHNMGLSHRSVGEEPHRQVHVFKESSVTASMAPPMSLPVGVSADAHRKGLSRAATFDLSESRVNLSGQYGTLGRHGRHGPTLELPDSPDEGLNNLRGVKSFADLRSWTPSPALSTSGYGQTSSIHSSNVVAQFGEYGANLGQSSSLTTPTTPGTASNSDLINDLKTMSLNDPYNSRTLRPRENPGAIGSQRPGINGTGGRNVPERQPHGPGGDWDKASGFAGRRANGHVQRGSDSSDNATRGAASVSTTRFQ
ncbi:RNA-binding post-transcriptional regulator cip2 [Rhypophila decipiens]|uniref:RNA-binding post-transcriptional regulator cip2 n=1 Tax=Rhypophila decipiens TaxID=261697 RepID=A0AAN7BD06_9PEZI|nr:RNA-binding post-transcriptional regulator cip2 [Rhypophila decipiens]